VRKSLPKPVRRSTRARVGQSGRQTRGQLQEAHRWFEGSVESKRQQPKEPKLRRFERVDVRRPNLFIVGAPRCGTTSLWSYLKGIRRTSCRLRRNSTSSMPTSGEKKGERMTEAFETGPLRSSSARPESCQ